MLQQLSNLVTAATAEGRLYKRPSAAEENVLLQSLQFINGYQNIKSKNYNQSALVRVLLIIQWQNWFIKSNLNHLSYEGRIFPFNFLCIYVYFRPLCRFETFWSFDDFSHYSWCIILLIIIGLYSRNLFCFFRRSLD